MPPPPDNHAVDTIYALSSGRPPAAIAIVRVSGPGTANAVRTLAGPLPEPRRAALRGLYDAAGDLLDRALLLWFPGPHSATGEDLCELHLHGGVAVVRAVQRALACHGLREAGPGEFTRQALLNGRIDLTEVEGLADLLEAETDAQRREAMARADGKLSRQVRTWMNDLVAISARLEATIDYDGEPEVVGQSDIRPDLGLLRQAMRQTLDLPPAERLRDGIRVALIGPVNAGKSSLFNALLGDEAAIVTDIAGTTRDLIERPIAFGGMPFILVDTAGTRTTDDPIEQLGIERSHRERLRADLLIDLNADASSSARTIAVAAKADLRSKLGEALPVSAHSGEGLHDLIGLIIARGTALLPGPGEAAMTRRVRTGIAEAAESLDAALACSDDLLVAENLRHARNRLDRLGGGGSVDAVLDALFTRFCLGK